MPHVQVNDTLREARRRAGLTQTDLSSRTGVSQSVISSMEGGHVPASLGAAISIARALSTSVEDLFGGLVVTPDPGEAANAEPAAAPRRRKASPKARPARNAERAAA